MLFQTALLLYALSALSGLLVITFLARFEPMANMWVRTLTGATAGVSSAWWAQGYSPFVSYFEAALTGQLGLGGFFFVASFVGLLCVWSFNLFRHNGVLIQ